MGKVWYEGGWIRDNIGNLRLYRAQEIETASSIYDIEPDVLITWRDYIMLRNWILENDKDGIVHSDRDEDLKIIHRLIDFMEKKKIS